MYVIGVEGMTCKNCASIIESSIKALDQDAEVGIDLLKKEVRVQTAKRRMKLGMFLRVRDMM